MSASELTYGASPLASARSFLAAAFTLATAVLSRGVIGRGLLRESRQYAPAASAAPKNNGSSSQTAAHRLGGQIAEAA